MPLSHNQEILFTRQRHEAERAGLHFDYRIVVGDKAYSWATRKDLPAPGKSILLHEQPIHTASYALSPTVIIPKGQYGAGVTTLDWVGKGTISNPEEDPEKFVVNLKDGQRFLLKKVPEKYGKKAWLFRNLSHEKTETIEKKAMSNKYLDHIEKKASFIGGAIATHLAQNIGTKVALKSKTVAKYLANSFSEGAHGVVNTSLKAKATRFATGAAVPEIAVAHKAAHDFGRSMKPILDDATKRQKVGLRMLTEGRFSDLKKYKLDKDPVIVKAHAIASTKVPLPSLEKTIEHSIKTEPLFKDKDHPLVSNIAKNISRGHKPVGDKFKPGTLDSKAPMSGALISAAIDPAGGALNTAKTLMSSKTFANSKVGGKVNEMLHKQFITNPIKSGVNVSKAGKVISNIKHKAYEIGVNPVSANLKRTSAAFADALKD